MAPMDVGGVRRRLEGKLQVSLREEESARRKMREATQKGDTTGAKVAEGDLQKAIRRTAKITQLLRDLK